jgi:3-phenylpropionate/trans-cinnamate dioxygenase ferredoxin component
MPDGSLDEWVVACKLGDLAVGAAVVVDVVPPIAVWNIEGAIYSTDDTCTHAESSLADGWLEGDVVECPFHLARFCVRDGRVVSPPAKGPLKTHRVRIDDGLVYVRTMPDEAVA